MDNRRFKNIPLLHIQPVQMELVLQWNHLTLLGALEWLCISEDLNKILNLKI